MKFTISKEYSYTVNGIHCQLCLEIFKSSTNDFKPHSYIFFLELWTPQKIPTHKVRISMGKVFKFDSTLFGGYFFLLFK